MLLAAESVLPPGQSGTVPQSGDNPHLDDQVALFEAFRFKPAGFNQAGPDTQRILTGGAGDVLERIRAWDGSYHAVDPATNTVDPGVAAWEALKDAAVRRLPRAARDWLGQPSVTLRFYDRGTWQQAVALGPGT